MYHAYTAAEDPDHSVASEVFKVSSDHMQWLLVKPSVGYSNVDVLKDAKASSTRRSTMEETYRLPMDRSDKDPTNNANYFSDKIRPRDGALMSHFRQLHQQSVTNALFALRSCHVSSTHHNGLVGLVPTYQYKRRSMYTTSC
jgi:hypothetical protein